MTFVSIMRGFLELPSLGPTIRHQKRELTVTRRNRRSRSGADAAVEATSPVGNVERFSAENRRRLSGPGFRAFLNIADLWRLTEAERLLVLGLPARSTYFNWASKARAGHDLTLSLDVLLRISAVLGVHKALRILAGGSRHEEVAWLREPHNAPTFGGQTPITLLTNGSQDGIMLVRRYLDALLEGVVAAPSPADLDFQPHSDNDVLVI